MGGGVGDGDSDDVENLKEGGAALGSGGECVVTAEGEDDNLSASGVTPRRMARTQPFFVK